MRANVTRPNLSLLVVVTVLTSAVALGCATAALKTDASSAGIRAAEEVGAQGVPRAALHLQLAKEGVAKAERLAADGEDERAASMLERAEADAELAVMLSREDAERRASKEAVERVRKLRHDNHDTLGGATSTRSQP